MKGKRVIITISEKHFEQLQELTKHLTPRERGKYLKLILENHIDKVNKNHEEKEETEKRRFPGLQLIINEWRKIRNEH